MQISQCIRHIQGHLQQLHANTAFPHLSKMCTEEALVLLPAILSVLNSKPQEGCALRTQR